MNFTPINEGEKAIIVKALARLDQGCGEDWYKKLTSFYLVQGNFFIALLNDGQAIQVGVAKRCPRDKENQTVAVNIALTRAARALSVRFKK